MTTAVAVVGALGALALLLGRTRALVAAGLLALGTAEALVMRDLLPGGLGSSVTTPAGLAALAVGVPLLVLLAAAFVRWPAAIVPAIVGTAPFRWPFEIGTEDGLTIGLGEAGSLGRLVPLYAVLGAGGLALLWRLARGENPRALPPALAVPAALLTGLTILSLVWAYDPAAAEDRLAFFVLPFVVVLGLVARAPFRPWLPQVLAVEAVALAVLFVAVGLVESWTRTLLFYDPKVAVANEYTSYFRVTSLFSDPSIYARHVALAITVLVVCLWLGRIGVLAGGALVAFLFAGIYVSYSQSTMVALAAAVALVTFLVADARARKLIAVTTAAVVLAGVAAFGALLAAGYGAERLTSTRTTLVADTWRVFRTHPLEGVGVASQPAASRDLTDGPRAARRHVSHTAPLTVAAELGVIGLALYLAFLAGALRLFSLVRQRDEALGLALLGVATVLFVHSLSYGVFFDDPLVWAVLGIGAAAAGTGEAALRVPAALRRPPRTSPAPAAR
jgi:hypothetical protein